MRRHFGRKFGRREIIEADLDLLPLMNLFISIIPMLLLSAVFVHLAAIELTLPPTVDSALSGEEKESLALAVTIRDRQYVVEGRGLPTQVIPREDGELAAGRLAEALAAISEQHPDNEDVMIISQSDTRYDDIVRVMDVSRDAGLPTVSLLGTRGN
jgi:biopolymer transport protein ExbD